MYLAIFSTYNIDHLINETGITLEILMKIILSSIILMLLPSPLFANSVYQCTVDGVSTFSQTPCDDEYKQIDD